MFYYVKDGSVYSVSRKGTNAISPAEGITVDTQFDYLMSAAFIESNNVDCIKKTEKDGITTYNIYMKTAATLSTKDKITAIINSNNAADVVDVDNYFDDDEYLIQDAAMVVEMKNGKILSIKIDTEIRYCPTEGDYTENQITLTNSIELTVDEEIETAAEYEAPERTNTVLLSLGLNNVTYYIR